MLYEGISTQKVAHLDIPTYILPYLDELLQNGRNTTIRTKMDKGVQT